MRPSDSGIARRGSNAAISGSSHLHPDLTTIPSHLSALIPHRYHCVASGSSRVLPTQLEDDSHKVKRQSPHPCAVRAAPEKPVTEEEMSGVAAVVAQAIIHNGNSTESAEQPRILSCHLHRHRGPAGCYLKRGRAAIAGR
ncbi:hypothetical protein GW7_09898 [Heterocephalus glaber]|uniref:Uncharacterized protein n=1 Tax=Heterocephalus glaber TaxID=10181 RepID=G5C886_HETGA|nr:hypothetical protein GW7_09898 [Heterocephalus glaber]